jgi:hypothetical protein
MQWMWPWQTVVLVNLRLSSITRKVPSQHGDVFLLMLSIFLVPNCSSLRFCKRKLVVLKDILDQSMLWPLILMGGGNNCQFVLWCLHLATVHFIWLWLCFIFLYDCAFDPRFISLCGYALNDTTMVIMVIYAILILIRMTQALWEQNFHWCVRISYWFIFCAFSLDIFFLNFWLLLLCALLDAIQ